MTAIAGGATNQSIPNTSMTQVVWTLAELDYPGYAFDGSRLHEYARGGGVRT
jgi:hypothetical protein